MPLQLSNLTSIWISYQRGLSIPGNNPSKIIFGPHPEEQWGDQNVHKFPWSFLLSSLRFSKNIGQVSQSNAEVIISQIFQKNNLSLFLEEQHNFIEQLKHPS